jgi:hypothetical protein
MPKIFITGSNETKGFVTGSGYISNPARVLLREKDNLLTNYPTVKRLNNKNTKGDSSLSSFNDNFSIAYADEIKDDFNFKKSESRIFFKNIDSKKWEVSSTEKIRRDTTLSSTQDFPNEGSFVFEGSGASGKRWLKTKTKILNPTVSFNVYQGPYDLNLVGLKLSQGRPEDILKVQTSTDGTTWEDVFINSYNVNNQYFLDVSGGYLKPFIDFSNAVLEGNQNNPGLIGISQTTPKNRPICNVSLSMREFNNHGSDSFYLRIVQDAISDQNTRVWAIGDIKVTSRNKSVSYPLLLNQGISTERELISSSIASSNQLSQLTVNAASVRNISDNYKYQNNSLNSLSPFTDTKTSFSSVPFYDSGVDASIYPGFSQKVLSKTKFEVDLSTNDEINLGIANSRPIGSIYGEAANVNQPTMCYWNKDLRKWESIGPGFRGNLELGFNMDTQKDVITSSILGFSNLGKIFTASGAALYDSTYSLIDDNIFSSYLRPTDTFGFPFSGRYHATASQYILASDIGITKDFLLEKITIDYNAKFPLSIPFAKTFRGTNNYQDGVPNYIKADIDGYGYRDLNFFILRQSLFNGKTEINVKRLDRTGADATFSYLEILPGYYDLNGDGVKETYVNETRDLITYGQTINLITGSGTDQTNGQVLFSDIIEKFSDRDNINIYDNTLITQITSSFSITSKCRNTPVLPNHTYVILGQLTGSNPDVGPVFTSKQKTGRSSGDLNIDSRGLLNNFSGFDPQEGLFEVKTPVNPNQLGDGSDISNVVLPKSSDASLTSPYIIKPTDKLVFGWTTSIGVEQTALDAIGTQHPTTIFGKSKLTLYGSQIKDSVEFHEGLNQNLITNNVYEVIGSEPVVDQFQVATRGELTGSHLTSFPYGNTSVADQLVYGYNIFDEKIFNHSLATNRLTNSVNGNAAPHFDNSVLALLPDASRYAISGLINKNSFNKMCLDVSRRYFDNTYNSGAPFKYLNNSYYGLIRSLTISAENEGNFKLTKSGQNENLPLYPKYEFNNKRFGHFADMIEQGKDSKFVNDPTTTADNIVVSPTVKVQFVRSEYDDSGLDVRSFFAVSPNKVNNTVDYNLGYQSSNLSLYATSSLPFFDDNTVRNRTYAPAIDGDPIETIVSEDGV